MFKEIRNKDIFYVGLQLFLFVLYFAVPFTFNVPGLIRYLGLIIAVAGVAECVLAILQLNKNLTPFPTPVKGGNLIRTGLYKFVRHPIYGGLILFFTGYAVYTQNFGRILVSLALWILFYHKSKYEESLLRKRYPEYESYSKITGRLFPVT
jgi:protein-S-isoprenylcysteine O-methyltransferase Ste14